MSISDYAPVEEDNKNYEQQRRHIMKMKRRSASLGDMNILAQEIPPSCSNSTTVNEKPNVLYSSHSTSRLKGFRKKLSIKRSQSRSNAELSPKLTGPDGCKSFSSVGGNCDIKRSLPEDLKLAIKEQRKNRKEKSIDNSSNCKQNIEHYDINNYDSVDVSENPAFESSILIKCEYLDDGNSPYETDEPDGVALADQKLEKLWKKIEKTKAELIRQQALKDENVAEYLKTTDNPTDTSINPKMKLNFERNNQKTNIHIQLIQKKLDKYQQQVKEIEENGVPDTKRIMKVVQNSVRSGTSSIADAVSKPLESLNNFIKKEKKNSSVENIATDEDETEKGLYHLVQTTSDEEVFSSSTSNLISASVLENIKRGICYSDNMNEDMDTLKVCVDRIERENQESKQSISLFKDALSRVLQSLQDERYKTEQLQSRLNDLFNQWNDLTELHQNEMMGMKEEMDRTLENIECVEYRFSERTADLQEDVENCITRISKIEKQQQDQQPIDTLLDMDARILLSKFLSFVINICVVIIFVVSSLTKLVMPVVSSKTRLVASVVALVILIVWKNSDYIPFFYFKDLLYIFS